eukprot:Awhi_evm1s7806
MRLTSSLPTVTDPSYTSNPSAAAAGSSLHTPRLNRLVKEENEEEEENGEGGGDGFSV